MSGTTQLPQVAIVGRPNVGKSALFNRLVGRKIAIVHDQPGITRDRLSATCTRGDRSFTLWDTGGILGAGESELTQQVRDAAQTALHQSDLLLFVVDGKSGVSPLDQELAKMLRRSHKPVVLVINKIDTPKHDALATDFDSLGFRDIISVSAEHDRAISDLLEVIGGHLPAVVGSTDIKPHTRNTEHSLAIAIIGRPNVGKSSLINSIVRSERAIVSELAGTTRESIDVFYERDGLTFVFIDTAGIRRRGKVASSADVFSVMRAERSIRRADLCVLVIDLTVGVTAQDKRIAGLIQQARKPAIVVMNKWDLVKPRRMGKEFARELIEETRSRVFFLSYAPVLVTSASTGENVDRLFASIDKIKNAARKRIGTGVLNRLLRQAFAANPPPLVKGKRLKLFYAAQTTGDSEGSDVDGEVPVTPNRLRRSRHRSPLHVPEFVLFVNDPHLVTQAYRRYLEARIREAEQYPGLPVILTMRARAQKRPLHSRHSNVGRK